MTRRIKGNVTTYQINCSFFSDANLSLGSSSGIIIAVPISKEESANGLEIEKATQTALKEAR